MRVVLVCYAAGPPVHRQNQRALVRSAQKVGITDVLAWRPDDLDADFRRTHAHILGQRRGAGFWLWKPHLIEAGLRRAGPDDIVCYLDSGLLVRRRFPELIARARQCDLLLVSNPQPNSRFTKRDCFILTDTDVPDCHAERQLDASVIVMKATDANRRLVRTWLDYATDARILTDQPNECGVPNLPDFRDHRHDQSVLSVLCWRHRNELPHERWPHRLKHDYVLHHRRRRTSVPIALWPYYLPLHRRMMRLRQWLRR